MRRVGAGVWSVDMGEAVLAGEGLEVTAEGLAGPRPGIAVAMPNPHVVVPVAAGELAGIDLEAAPDLAPAPPAGANVEFAVLEPATRAQAAASAAEGRVRLRVHERGVGETMSCGTGVAAAVVALAARWAGPGAAPSVWRVGVPGGELKVVLDGPRTDLEGPAALVYAGALA
jgi:diaminopimelate epimerase